MVRRDAAAPSREEDYFVFTELVEEVCSAAKLPSRCPCTAHTMLPILLPLQPLLLLAALQPLLLLATLLPLLLLAVMQLLPLTAQPLLLLAVGCSTCSSC